MNEYLHSGSVRDVSAGKGHSFVGLSHEQEALVRTLGSTRDVGVSDFVAVCCSVLQCVAVCFRCAADSFISATIHSCLGSAREVSVSNFVAVCCSVWQGVAARCSVL